MQQSHFASDDDRKHSGYRQQGLNESPCCKDTISESPEGHDEDNVSLRVPDCQV